MSYEFTSRERDSEKVSQDTEEIAGLADELLTKFHSGNALTFVDLASREKASDVRQELQSTTLGDVLLTDGESLSLYSAEEYARDEEEHLRHPDLQLFANTEKTKVLGRVGLRVWGKGWDFEDGSWLRQIDVSFAHVNKEARKYAVESISMGAGSSRRSPTLFREISAPDYAETGYEGHGFKSRESTPEDVRVFVAIVKRLLEMDRLDEAATTD